RLAGGVRPAQDLRGTEETILILGEWNLRPLAVDLGGGEENDRLVARAVRGLEHVLGASDVGQERAERILKDELDAHGRGEVINEIDAVRELLDQRRIHHRAFDEMEARFVLQIFEVAYASRGEVIDCPNLVAPRDQGFNQVRANEACTPSDQYSHSLPRIVVRHYTALAGARDRNA